MLDDIVIKERSIRNKKVHSYLLFILLSLGTSVIANILGLHRILIYFICIICLLYLINIRTNRSINKPLLLVLTTISLLGLIPMLYWMSPRFFIQPIFFLTALFILHNLSILEIEKSVKMLSNFLLILLILAVLSSVITFFGVQKIPIGVNPDGREINLFFLTLSNAAYNYNGKLVIRPSGIYEEPGLFSFIICALSIIRSQLSLSAKKTYWLLLLGLITLSLAHLIFLTVYFFSKIVSYNKIQLSKVFKAYGFTLFTILIVLLFAPTLKLILSEFLISRLDFTSLANLGGNRTPSFVRAYDLLNSDTFLFGLDPLCLSDSVECSLKYGNFRDNPLSPLILGGIFNSIIYYSMLLILIFNILRKRKYLYTLAFILIMLQRPSIMSPGLDFYFAIILLLILKISPYVKYHHRLIEQP